MDIEQCLWLAGWLEGEGCFTLSSGTLSIQACSTDLDVIERVAALLGTTHVTKKKPTPLTRRQAYICRTFGDKAADTMRLILPYMGERRAGRIRELSVHHANRHVRRSAATQKP